MQFVNVAAIAFALAAGAELTSQCNSTWSPATSLVGTDRAILATTQWDPDGAGPLPSVVVCGGRFDGAGSSRCRRVATYNPLTEQWAPLGDGFDLEVRALAVLPSGTLVAGGTFRFSGATYTSGLAQWNGAAWQPFAGSGVLGDVHALEVTNAGNLLVGGSLTQAGTLPVGKFAIWDGATWSTYGFGFDDNVNSIDEATNGDIAVGGNFRYTDGLPGAGVAVWDGSSWSNPGGGTNQVTSPTVHAVKYLNSGTLLLGGYLLSGATGFVALEGWNGTSWSSPYTISQGRVRSIDQLADGTIIIGGPFSNGTGTVGISAAIWDNTSGTWIDQGLRLESTYSFELLPNGNLLAAGDARTAGATDIGHLGVFDGSAWRAPNAGTEGWVQQITSSPQGDLVVAGRFTTIGGVAARNIAIRNGSTWSPLGTGLSGSNSFQVLDLLVRDSGDVIACGTFSTAGGLPAGGIASWDGSTWSTLGASPFSSVDAVTERANGNLIAVGFDSNLTTHRVMEWDGSSWSALGDLGSPTGPRGVRLVTQANGDVFLTGRFTTIDGIAANNVAIWNGAAWTPMGMGLDSSGYDAANLPNGDLVVTGPFLRAGTQFASGIARWDGQQWSPLGLGIDGQGFHLAPLPNGDIVVAGWLTWAGMTPANKLARWTGSSWTALEYDGEMRVTATAYHQGELLVARTAPVLSDPYEPAIRRYRTNCQATVTSVGSGCSGSAGTNVLAADSMPWVGSTFRATATGMPTLSLAVGVYGAAINQPLAGVLPQGLPGCSALAAPDFLQLLTTNGGSGTATSSLRIPNMPALAGIGFEHQVLALDLDPLGNIVAATTTNALRLQLGAF
ncbi:MAG: hypothetical protein AB8H80_18555 [Planctomycetota bacterium]